MGDKWEEYPLMSLDLGETVFQFFRHYELYASVRVERFLSEYWYGSNNETTKPYNELNGWENQCRRFYTKCYNAAKEQAGKVNK